MNTNKKIFFDVGSHNGSWSRRKATTPNSLVYAFEPTPFLLEKFLYPLEKQFNNIKVIPKAVGISNDLVDFYVAGNRKDFQSDWGCGSIHKFSDDLHITWPGRSDFKVTEEIQVESITMKNFVEDNDIQKIDFFHCDTQGNDLNVLMSFGDKLSIIEEGEIEVFAQNPLYQKINNSRESCEAFLEENGYRVTGLSCNDKFGNEFNLRFAKNPINCEK